MGAAMRKNYLCSFALAVAAALGSACGTSNDPSGGGGGGTAGAGGSPVGGAAGAGGVSGAAGTGGGDLNPLGRRCTADADCGDLGLFCLTANSTDLDGEGPAKGYCTIECSDGESCSLVGESARCRELQNGKQFCFEGCSFGPLGTTTLEDTKCHGRPEVACTPLYVGQNNVFDAPVCVPRCNSDADCGGSLRCSPRTGTCTTADPSGGAVGDPCTPDEFGGNCRGWCSPVVLPGTSTIYTHMCTEGCTSGAWPSCGGDTGNGGAASAACAGENTTVGKNGGTGAGDLAVCVPTCNCNAECKNPDFACYASKDPSFEKKYGKPGRCYGPKTSANPGIEVCPG